MVWILLMEFTLPNNIHVAAWVHPILFYSDGKKTRNSPPCNHQNVCFSFSLIVYLYGLSHCSVFEYLSMFRRLTTDQQISSQFLPWISQSRNTLCPVVRRYVANRKALLCQDYRPTQNLLHGQLEQQEEETHAHYRKHWGARRENHSVEL